MKKYRLGYDYLFLANKSFDYKGDFIRTMAINVLFKVFDEDKNEMLFESDNLEDQRLYFKNRNSCYVSDLYNCFIDKNYIFKLIPNISLLKESGYTVKTSIYSYTKAIDKGISKGIFLEPEIIEEDEFKDIMKNNINLFINATNSPAQSTSYFTEEVKENELPKILGKKYPKIAPKERFKLELVTNVERIFKYKSCNPILINNNISSAAEARKLAKSKENLLKGKQFFLLTKYENERLIFSGKLYI